MSQFKSLLGLNELAVDNLNILNLDLTNTNIVGLNTDKVPEDANPVNLYFTNTRFDTRLSTKSTGDIKEGKNLYYTEQRVSNNADVYASTQHRSNTSNPHQTSLVNLLDTNISAQAVGQYLTYNDVDGKWRNTYFGSIDTLSDVVITAPIAANSYLTYNNIVNWVNKTFPISVDESGNIGMLGTLNITGVNLLNTKDVDTWITEHEANNDKISADGSIDTHSDVSIATAADNQLLIYSTGQWRNTNSPFLRLDGTANMTGGLNMNSQNITNAGQLNGRSVATLYSEHDTNKAKVSADGSIDTHSDVIISTAADNQLLIYSTGQWRNQNSPFLRLDGTASMTAGLNMGEFAITNVGNVDGIDVSALDTNVVKLSTDQTVGGNKTFSDKITTSLISTISRPIIIGNTTKDTGATGGLELYGTASNIGGAHLQAITTQDAYPTFQLLNWTHDNVSLVFDSYFDGTNWKSSHSGSNFLIQKGGNKLVFNYKSGITAGNNITWSEAMNISTAGLLTANAGVSTTTLTTSDNVVIGTGKSIFIDRSGTTIANKLVLWDGGTPSATAFLGFGVSPSTLIYNVNSSTDSHVFYYGGSNELLRINNTAITATKSIIANGGLNMNSQNITNTDSLNRRVVSTLFTEHDANKTKVSADGSIDTHSDVIISTPQNGQLLTYNGTNWVNSTGTLSFLALSGGTMAGDVKYGASAFTLYTAPQAMTSNNSVGFVASASNEYNPAYYAFNASQNDYWTTAIYYNDTTGVYSRTPATTNTWGGTPYTGKYIKIDLGAIYKIKNYYVRSSSANYIETTPSMWYVGVSTDNITFTLWDSRSGEAWASQTTKTYSPASNATARYIIFIVNKTGSGGTSFRSQPRIASLYFDYETFNYDITLIRNITSDTLTTSGAITASGLITANAGLTGTTLTASGLITANAGVDMKTQKITNLATPTVSTDGATKDYVDTKDGQNMKLTGDQTIAGTKEFSEKLATSLGIPCIIGRNTKGTAATGGLELYGTSANLKN